ncbi:hypothetical protein ACEYX6_03510 [Acinetobacter sp. c2-A9]|uniref:hypothetical protein n=1 Tax=Acinetobacter sp. c2-A9 TaxID=3342802 RepID=UPI0035BA7DE0
MIFCRVQRKMCYIELTERYQDGTWINVNNAGQSGAFPYFSDFPAFYLEKNLSLSELISIQKQLATKLKIHTHAIPASPLEDYAQVINHITQRICENLIKQGWTTGEILADNSYRFSYKGTLLSMYRFLPITKNWAWQYRKNKMLKILNQ